jgi:hypothetical protein
VLEGRNLTHLLDAILAADRRRAEAEPAVADADHVEPAEVDVDHVEPAEVDVDWVEPAEVEADWVEPGEVEAEEDVAGEDVGWGQPVVGEDRPPTQAQAEALRLLREVVDETDSSVPLRGRVRTIQLRREVTDFLLAVLEQPPPASPPTDAGAEAGAETAADTAEADQDGQEN